MSTPLFNDALGFIVLERKAGEVLRIYPPNTEEATYVSTSICIARRLLNGERARGVLKKIAQKLPPQPSQHWRCEMSDDEAVNIYIHKVLHRFPLVFVDDSL